MLIPDQVSISFEENKFSNKLFDFKLNLETVILSYLAS